MKQPSARELELRIMLHRIEEMAGEWLAEEPTTAVEWHAIGQLQCAARDLFDAAGCDARARNVA